MIHIWYIYAKPQLILEFPSLQMFLLDPLLLCCFFSISTSTHLVFVLKALTQTLLALLAVNGVHQEMHI